MLFPTPGFFVFFVAVFFFSWGLIRHRHLRSWFLILASYGFYASFEKRFVPLLVLSSLGNWLVGLLIARAATERARKTLVTVGIVANLSLLAYFKYFRFVTSSLEDLSEQLGAPPHLTISELVLPLGISFFTFHGISYIVDVFKRRVKVPASLEETLLYMAFFPQLVAGPIVRASHMLPQLRAAADPNDIRLSRSVLLILVGLLKKVIVANYLGTELVDEVFREPTEFGRADLLLAVYGYAFQIFCDFSGYTDMAIGLAGLLGYRFPKNFNQPYRALNVSDFWRRWHISLSTWLRDYLYIPLGGNRGTFSPYRNLMITMLLGGLWHGAAWNFVVWGGLHGVYLMFNRLAERSARISQFMQGVPDLVKMAFTFHLVCFAWILFRAASLDDAGEYLGALWTGSSHPSQKWTPFIALLMILGASFHVAPGTLNRTIETVETRIPGPLLGVLAGAVIVVIFGLGPSGALPFIYFRF